MSKELLLPGSKGGYLGKGVIEYVGHPSTATRLHELHHKLAGHEPGSYTPQEAASNEVDAEVFSWEKRGKELNPRVGYPAYVSLLSEGIKPRRAFGIVSQELRSRHILIEREDIDWYKSRGITKRSGGWVY